MLPSRVRFIERDWLSSNMVLLHDAGEGANAEFTLIDSGYAKHEAFTLNLVRHQLKGGKLRRLINTHLHSDHCGGNAVLSREFGCSITVPSSSFEAAAKWDMTRLSFEGTGQRCARFTPQFAMQSGESFEAGQLQWQVFASPGHDNDSQIFFCEKERILISADALWENGFGVLFPEISDEPCMDEQAQVLDLIESLNPRIVIPGHGSMFTDLASALKKSRELLTALRTKPERVARNLIKVLVKYLLLDRERVHVQGFIDEVSQTQLNLAAAAKLGRPLPDLLAEALDELCAKGLAKREGEFALNCEPVFQV